MIFLTIKNALYTTIIKFFFTKLNKNEINNFSQIPWKIFQQHVQKQSKTIYRSLFQCSQLGRQSSTGSLENAQRYFWLLVMRDNRIIFSPWSYQICIRSRKLEKLRIFSHFLSEIFISHIGKSRRFDSTNIRFSVFETFYSRFLHKDRKFSSIFSQFSFSLFIPPKIFSMFALRSRDY